MSDINGDGILDLIVCQIDNPARKNRGYYRVIFSPLFHRREVEDCGKATVWDPIEQLKLSSLVESMLVPAEGVKVRSAAEGDPRSSADILFEA